MAFIAHYRGRVLPYEGPFHDSMLLHEVDLDTFLDERYPSFLLKNYPEQARADRDKERAAINGMMAPGDGLWLWRRVDPGDRTDGSALEWGGLALRRAGSTIRVWLVWQEN